MPSFESFLPSDEWQAAGVHWHAFSEARDRDSSAHMGDRLARRERSPEVVLRTPWEVVSWIDQQTRRHVHKRKVWALHEGVWVKIGDEDDLDNSRQVNFGIASRGDSIYVDVYSETERHDVFVEAVTDEQCPHGCATGNTQ